MSTNLAPLQLTDFQPSYFDTDIIDFRVGNSRFLDDTWDFKGFHTEKGLTEGRYQIRFEPIKHSKIKLVIKQFLVYDLLKNSFPTAKRDFDGFKRFYSYIEEYYPRLDSLSKLNKVIVAGYFQHLLEAKSSKTGELLSRTSLFKNSQVLKDILLEGSKAGWDVPSDCTWIRLLYNEMIEKSPRAKLVRKTSKDHLVQETIEKVISCALKDSNVFAKASIIIQCQVGYRINELLSLVAGCMVQKNGQWFIRHWTRKTQKEPVLKQKPANELVLQCVQELEQATEQLRKESGITELFIQRSPDGVVRHFFKENWNRDVVHPFIERWDIRENGELIEFTSHDCRHVFASWAYRKGMPIESILKMFDHSSLAMTETYTHITEQDMKAKMEEIFSEDAVLAGVSVGRIKERLKTDNPFKGKTQKQIELVMQAMRINVRPNGVCFHHPGRQEACAGDGDCVTCANFVSHEIHLPIHKQRVLKLEEEMQRAEKSGNTLWYSKNKSLRDHIQKVFIEPLEAELKLRGGVGDGA